LRHYFERETDVRSIARGHFSSCSAALRFLPSATAIVSLGTLSMQTSYKFMSARAFLSAVKFDEDVSVARHEKRRVH
jgi:hypothetical protein